MSHSPPIPPGNQSPFPLQEPPHPPAPPTPPAREATADAAGSGLLPLIAGAAGLGVVVAGAAALFFRSRDAESGTKKKAKKRKEGGNGRG